MTKRLILIFTAALLFEGTALRAQGLTQETFKIGKTLALLEAIYVDSVNISSITEQMIIGTLGTLIPIRYIFRQRRCRRRTSRFRVTLKE